MDMLGIEALGLSCCYCEFLRCEMGSISIGVVVIVVVWSGGICWYRWRRLVWINRKEVQPIKMRLAGRYMSYPGL